MPVTTMPSSPGCRGHQKFVQWSHETTGDRAVPPEFEWDAAKARENLKKHGVAFEEALTVFANPLARIFDDSDHSENEQRELIIGHSATRRLLVISFTERRPRTRIISARQATPNERRKYEENTPDSTI
jgi:uncharacterized DUF497 family protein